jgi:uncharacterized repeat protein (TIGR01451 family)
MDGEVEDYRVFIESNQIDFGDAPAPFPTVWNNNGARHNLVPGFFLGGSVCADPNGSPSPTAEGDDDCGPLVEEDGVFVGPLWVGQPGSVQVTASAAGRLDGWIDWNADGAWADASEKIFHGQPLNAGLNNLSILAPAWATPTNGTFARVRFSTQGFLPFDGPAPDGEVEDWKVSLAPAADLGVTLAASPNPVMAGCPLTYTITVANAGPSPGTLVQVSDELPPGADYVSATPSQGNCLYVPALHTVLCNLGTLNPGDLATITVAAKPLSAGTILNGASVSGIAMDPLFSNNAASLTTQVLPPPTLTITVNGPVVTLSFATEADCVYLVEYTQSLNSGIWILLQTVIGTGASVTVTDTAPGATMRFYRVRVP